MFFEIKKRRINREDEFIDNILTNKLRRAILTQSLYGLPLLKLGSHQTLVIGLFTE